MGSVGCGCGGRGGCAVGVAVAVAVAVTAGDDDLRGQGRGTGRASGMEAIERGEQLERAAATDDRWWMMPACRGQHTNRDQASRGPSDTERQSDPRARLNAGLQRAHWGGMMEEWVYVWSFDLYPRSQ